MEKFASIESLKHAIANVRRYCNERNQPWPTLTFEGTVKLHGTNGGIRRSPSGKIQAQSRERIIDIQSDNAGFAAFVLRENEAIEKLFKRYGSHHDVILFGEWCGGNIQKSIGISSLEKHFVLFKVMVDGDYVKLPHDLHDNEHGIWNIYQIPSYHVTIDFTSPEPASEALANLTLAVEQKCPWAVFRGVKPENEGDLLIGEGLVWSCSDLDENLGIWFKTKGMLHKGNDRTKSPKIKIDDQKMASIKELVEEILPQWRLEQGISYLRENNIDIIAHNTGEYLKWIAKDIDKEEKETIAASGFEWKQIQGQVMQTARQFWLTEINKVE